MATAKAVAAYLIEKASALGGSSEELSGNNDLTNLKLQKLLYFAQVKYLKETGDLLFDEPIEAWKYGPVVRSIYERLKGYGAYVVTDFDEDTSAAEELSADEKAFLDRFFEEYAKYSAWALVNKTHEADSPWDKIYDDGAGETREIPIELLKTASLMS